MNTRTTPSLIALRLRCEVRLEHTQDVDRRIRLLNMVRRIQKELNARQVPIAWDTTGRPDLTNDKNLD